MPKRFDLDIDEYQVAPFVSAIRLKSDVIILWMRAIKAFLTNNPAPAQKAVAKLSIISSNMTRLFCTLSTGTKIFSVNFPFYFSSNDEEMSFRSRNGHVIDHRVSSEILSLVQNKRVLDIEDFDKFFDPIFEAADAQATMWSLLRELMLAEDGYLRYDWDIDRVNGDVHPEHHIDVCYSNGSSFKIGLRSQLSCDTLIGILDSETACHYLAESR